MTRDSPQTTTGSGNGRTRRGLLRDLARLGSGMAGLALLASCAPTPVPVDPARVYRVGLYSNLVRDAVPDVHMPFWDRLGELGYVEGRNLARDVRAVVGGEPGPWADVVEELAGLPVDVIVVTDGPPFQIDIAATTSIPVVLMRTSQDVVATGQVGTLARPGGNVTGVVGAPGDELDVKRVELLVGAAPGVSRIGVVGSIPDFSRDPWRSAARSYAVEFRDQTDQPVLGVPIDFEAAFERARVEQVDALLIRPGRATIPNSALIGRLAERHRLPAVFQTRSFVTAGGLMAYGPRQSEVERRAADLVDRILRGAQPKDLPMEVPARYDLIVNMRTARALGLTLGPTIFDQITELIE